MTRQRLFGTQLEILLAEMMSPGKCNYNISRYVQFDGELDVQALTAAVETALSEAGITHCDYEIASDGAWQIDSAKGPCRVGIIDLQDAPDPMNRCLELISNDTNTLVPILSKEDKVKQIIFQLGECEGQSRWIWYQRCHHILADGYSLQRMLKRVADLYSAHSNHTNPEPGDFLGYAALLEEHTSYVESEQCAADKAFWGEYLTEYLNRTDASLLKDGEVGAEPFLRSISMARGTGDGNARLPIESIAAATMTTMQQVSGLACPMIGMSYGRRNRQNLDRVVSPMVSILPLWIDLGVNHERGAVESQIRDELREIRKHQFYGGEQALRDLGYTGGRGGLYLSTLNFRVYVSNAVSFDNVDSALHFVASPFTGIDITVDMPNGELRLSAKATYESVYGMDIRTFVDLLFDNVRSSVGVGSGV
jgi:hypothetical protein